jgi:hypothetical protein
MITTTQAFRITIAQLKAAGMFDAGDLKGYIDIGPERLPFIYRAEGAGYLSLGGYRYAFAWMPSNLGRGRLRYFVCPFTRQRTRTLYSPIRSGPFAHRTAFRPAIGYATQLTGRLYHLRRSFEMEEQAEQMREGVTRWYHKGEPTRRVARILAMEERANAYWGHAVRSSPTLHRIAARMTRDGY